MVVHGDKDIYFVLNYITRMAIDQRIHTQTAAITSTWEAIEPSLSNDHEVMIETFPNYAQSTLEFTEKERGYCHYEAGRKENNMEQDPMEHDNIKSNRNTAKY